MSIYNKTFIVTTPFEIFVEKNEFDKVPPSRMSRKSWKGCYYTLKKGEKFNVDQLNHYDVSWFHTQSGIRFRIDCGDPTSFTSRNGCKVVDQELYIDYSNSHSAIDTNSNMLRITYSDWRRSVKSKVAHIKLADLRKDMDLIKAIPFFTDLNEMQVELAYSVAKEYLSNNKKEFSLFDKSLQVSEDLPMVSILPYHINVTIDGKHYDVHKNIFKSVFIEFGSIKENKAIIASVLKISFLPYSMYNTKQRRECVDIIFRALINY